MGGIDLQLEEILAEGKRFERCQATEMCEKRKRARMAVVPIEDLISDIDQRVSNFPSHITKQHFLLFSPNQ